MAGALSPRTRRRRGARRGYQSEINVTPFVDVMLVLLIVFMVTAPMLTAGVPLKLPNVEARPLPAEQRPLTVSVQADGAIFLQETAIELDALLPRLQALAGEGYTQRIFIRADASAAYGRVAEVMATMNAAGYRNLGLVTDPLRAKASNRPDSAPDGEP